MSYCQECGHDNTELYGEEVVLHRRIIEISNLFKKMQEVMLNPYWEYHMHDIVSREIQSGTEFVRKLHPIIPEDKIRNRMKYDENNSTIEFYTSFE